MPRVIIVSFVMLVAALFSAAIGYNSASGYREFTVTVLLMGIAWALPVEALRLALARERRAAVPKNGLRAAREGFQLQDNPYRQHTPDHSIWRDDWLDAMGRRK